MEKRQYHYDALRIFSTFLVIILHSASKQWYAADITTEAWHVFNVYDSLVRCAVPLFFMLSGVQFLSPDKPLSMKKVWRRNIPRLLISFYVWSAIYARLHYLRGVIDYEEGKFQLRILLGNYHLWFILVLVGLYICLPVLRQIAENKVVLEYFIRIYFVITLGITFFSINPEYKYYLSPLLENTQLHLIAGYSGYFLLGHYLDRYTPKGKEELLIHLLSLMSVPLTIAGTHYLSYTAGEASSELYGYLLPTTFFVSSSVFLLFLHLKDRIPTLLHHGILQLSALSFSVYLCHDVFLITLLEDRYWIYWDIPAVWSVPLFAIVIYGLSAGLSYFISLIPVVNRILI